MTYEQLLDHIENMTEEQLKCPVVLLFNNEWVFPNTILSVNKTFVEEEGFAVGQQILV